ncbi:unnamed protein product [Caenorhabditis brenneri]
MSSSDSNSSPGPQQDDSWRTHSTPIAQGQIVRNSGFGSQRVREYGTPMNGGARVHPYQQGGSNTRYPSWRSQNTSTPSHHSPGLANVQTPPLTFSPNDMDAILNADIPADVEFDLKDLCHKVSTEIAERGISRALFSERILHRSQGTISELLNWPKPWENILEKGRRPYIRMYNWLKQPFEIRMAMLYVPEGTSGTPTRKSPPGQDEFERTREVFTEIQRTILDKLFKETAWPSTRMKDMLADHLGLEFTQIDNFFKNARRRRPRLVNDDDN